MRPSGVSYLITVASYSLMGAILSAMGNYVAALLSLGIAGGAIAYYQQAVIAAEALELAKDCLAGWKKALEDFAP